LRRTRRNIAGRKFCRQVLPIFLSRTCSHCPNAALPLENAVVAVGDEEDAAVPLLSPTAAVVEVGAGAPLLMLLSVAHPTGTPRVQVREGDALAVAFGLPMPSRRRACHPRRPALLHLHRALVLAAASWSLASRSQPVVERPRAPCRHMSPAALGLANGTSYDACLPGPILRRGRPWWQRLRPTVNSADAAAEVHGGECVDRHGLNGNRFGDNDTVKYSLAAVPYLLVQPRSLSNLGF
jgi:hypothetical protein